MKTIKYILASLAIVLVAASCVKDLNVTPIDPNKNTADKALVSEQDFEAFLAGIYTGYATSGYYGPNGDPSIKGLDGGMSQYIRGLFHLCELPTDVYVCGWNDEGVPDVCKMQWDASTGLIYSIYSRMFFQVAQCNEFIRQAQQTNLAFESKDQMIAEARALRALSYYHAIDNFGNVPFADETSVVGSLPGKKTRTELYEWLETELRDIIDNSKLPDPKRGQYGRIDKGAAKMVLAKLYLNAQVYTGTAQWEKCAGVVKDLMDDGYSLHTTPRGLYTAYQDLFLADNDQCTDEIIFAVQQDGEDTQSYGVTNYLVFAFTGGSMAPADLGISSGWSGCRMTPEFYNKFDTVNDKRAIFWTDGQTLDVTDFGDFTNGIGFQKYKNMKADGTPGKAAGFVDTDFPVFRYADVLLMAAECALNGSSITTTEGLKALNDVRARAGMPASNGLSADDLLDERARELYLELWRRQDLIRFNKFTTADYIWQWKGGVHDGKAVEDYKNLYPIPASDIMVNPDLEQNPGYNNQ
jgi:hypothetical protein